ncbi:hypothetical protein KIH39_03460 [Telmatocola sphagniphila]|uniref:Lipopolysaccharide core heptose(I) kinase RfaP n=1 Tax=Telmatocola sphagniphila TaxID=1123043 RepID=A0A8E6B758_9BACT|nr:lipopolysaccharide kinase InaA family protein [Telmatocola sphagniphila]QVL32986.1 hypothetical protein KIH39_03460 [Telmatocola sphagniphila]
MARRENRRDRLVSQPEWESIAGVGWADRIMELELSDRFHSKQGRSIVRWTVTNLGNPCVVYLKRHYKLPRWMSWARRYLPNKDFSPGLQEYHHLQWAVKQGIPVPKALAAGEFQGENGQLQGFIAIAELTDMIGLHEAIPEAERKLSPEDFRWWKHGLFAELARLSHLFHDRNAYHQDWYLCHFYIPQRMCDTPPAEWQGQVFVIDFHRLRTGPILGFQSRMKDLAQLQYSAIWPGVTAEDRQHFWKIYSKSLPRIYRKLLRWGIEIKMALYRRNHRRAERRKHAHT